MKTKILASILLTALFISCEDQDVKRQAITYTDISGNWGLSIEGLTLSFTVKHSNNVFTITSAQWTATDSEGNEQAATLKAPFELSFYNDQQIERIELEQGQIGDLDHNRVILMDLDINQDFTQISAEGLNLVVNGSDNEFIPGSVVISRE